MYNVAFVSEALVRKEKIQAALRKMSADALLLADNAASDVYKRQVIHMSRPKAI